MRHLTKTIMMASIALSWATPSLPDDINIGYQTGIEPAKVAIADKDYERVSGEKINWRRFDNGAELIRAIASGDVDIGNIGSTIVAAAASRHLPIKTFLVAAQLGSSEAFIVRNGSGINKPEDLLGKTIAVPFVSTSHYSLLSALKHWQLDTRKIKIINLRAAEISAAWRRGDIDGAYVWEPALGAIKESGKVLATSADVATWGAPTFDLWVVSDKFAAKNSHFLTTFSQVSLAKIDAYQSNPNAFSENLQNLNKIASVTGAKTSDIHALLGGDTYPRLSQQHALLSNTVANAISDTAFFLKAQGKLDVVLPDYRTFTTVQYLNPYSAQK